MTDGQLIGFALIVVPALVVTLIVGAHSWYRNERMRKNPSYGARRVTVSRDPGKPYVITNVRHRPRVR